MKIPGKSPFKVIKSKLTSSGSNLLNDAVVGKQSSVVSIDANKILFKKNTKSYSVKFINYVEPYLIKGQRYTLFYTEINHNLKIGDRVFIVGGVYDTDLLISNNKFGKGCDGYIVQYVEKTKVVLNIEYTGDLPYIDDPIDNFIKIYVASTQEEFDYLCQTTSTRGFEYISNRFSYVGTHSNNNFLYISSTFSVSSGNFGILGFSYSSTTSLTYSNSFLYLGGILNGYLTDMTNDILSGSYSGYLGYGLTNSGRIKIIGGTFSQNGTDFQDDYVYKYNNLLSKWEVDRTYMDPFITEQNFRNGRFKSGEHNQGLFGTSLKKIIYNGPDVNFTLGTVLNTKWENGDIGNGEGALLSYVTNIDEYGLPVIKSNSNNNGGYGYNYFYETDLLKSTIINSNIIKSNIGKYSTYSVLENHLTGISLTYSVLTGKSRIYSTKIENSRIENSLLDNCLVNNTNMYSTKSVNSEINQSLFNLSKFTSDNIIKITGYQETYINHYLDSSLQLYKVYKFYISEPALKRIKNFRNFYLSGLKINKSDLPLLNFFDDKFSIDSYYSSYDESSKISRKVIVQLSTTEDNKKTYATYSSDINFTSDNKYYGNPSIDILVEISKSENFNNQISDDTSIISNSEVMDVSLAYIIDSDFKSGLFKKSDWINGNYINYNLDNSLSNLSDSYDISSIVNSSDPAFLRIKIGPQKRKSLVNVNDIVFLNAIQYKKEDTNVVYLPDTYKVSTLTGDSSNRDVSLQDIVNGTSSVLNNIEEYINDYLLLTKNAQNKYNYIHPVKFEDSRIYSGIFRRAYFSGSTIQNDTFNSFEKNPSNYNNYRKILISDTIFSNNGNIINSGVIFNSHFVSGNDTWNNGILLNSIWNTESFTYSIGPTSSSIISMTGSSFKNGMVKQSRWQYGTFENGLFYKNGSNNVGTSSVYSDGVESYYRTSNYNKYSWIDGVFKNGVFEMSNWEYGKFLGGDFLNSNFFDGEASSGNFGRRNIPVTFTKVLSGSFSNLNVVNSEFRSQNPDGSISGTHSIEWHSGNFNNGIFGVKIDNQYYDQLELAYPFSSIWRDGTFNGGNFTDTSVWQNGVFNGGKFTSYYGYPFVTSASYSTATYSYFAWQNGEFNGGEFGNAGLTANSTWYMGEFNGGIFRGRYWHNGVFTRGHFMGSGGMTTSLTNIPKYVSDFSNEFYGMWNDGFVSEVKDSLIKNKKFYTQLEREFSKKKKSKVVNINNALWKSGTFSHSDGIISNSVWLDGTFQKGIFYGSSFNPYVNKIVNSTFSDSEGSSSLSEWEFNFSDDTGVGAQVIPLSNKMSFTGTSSVSIGYQTAGLDVGSIYTAKIKVSEVSNAYLRWGSQINPLYNGNFNSTASWVLFATSSADTTSLNITTGYPGYLTYDASVQEASEYAFAIYPDVLEIGKSYYVSMNVFGGTNSPPISVGSSQHDLLSSPIILIGGNETFSVPDTTNQDILTFSFTAQFTDFTIRMSCDNVSGGSMNIHNIQLTKNEILTSSDSSSDVNYNFTFSADGPDFALEFIEKSTTESYGATWSGSTVSISSIEIIKGNSGFNLNDSCVWENGIFEARQDSNGLIGGEFFISKWKNGKWKSGNSYGMIWQNGIADYMSAYNCYWEGGIWKNGNWNGSPFTHQNTADGFVSQGFASDIITNVSLYRQASGDVNYQDIFINDAFTVSSSSEILIDTDLSDGFTSVTFSNGVGKNWFAMDTYPVAAGQYASPPHRWTSIIDGNNYNVQVYPNPYVYDDSVLSGSLFNATTNYSDKLYAIDNLDNSNIFTSSNTEYQIEIKYLCTYGPTTSPVSEAILNFEIGVGTSSTFINNGGFKADISEHMRVYEIGNDLGSYFGQTSIKTVNYTFIPSGITSSTNDSNALWIKKVNSTKSSTLYITNVSIRSVSTQYDTIYNNATYSILNENPLYSDSLEMPPIELIGGSSDDSNLILTRFGNGIFTSGTFSSVWENGVWNEGLRWDNKMVYFKDISSYPNSNKPVSLSGSINQGNISYRSDSWIISVDVVQDNLSFSGYSVDQTSISLTQSFNIGDRVSVGNIVSVDINGNRRLIKDYFTVVNIVSDPNVKSLILQVPVIFPIRRIEKDSENHLIYISKNIWLNGAFLNGLFKGVWNNGLVKGYPYITTIVDSQWTDGRFDGGHFKGLTVSLESSSQIYNSSVVQNFIFRDNNEGTSESTNLLNYSRYNSWIEFNYFTSSMSNIYQDVIAHDEGFKTKKSILNYNGYPTKDILSSLSYFKNMEDDNINTYSLGWKYTKYVDYIDNPYFNYPISSTQSLSILGQGNFDEITTDYSLSTTYSIPGLYEFVSNSWRPLALNASEPAEYTANTNFQNTNKLRVIAGTSTGANLLENLNTLNIPKFRYSVVEFEMSHSSSELSYPYLLNEPIAKYFADNDEVLYTSAVPSFIKHNQTQEKTKIEYFYNRPSLQMVLVGVVEYYDTWFVPTVGLSFSKPHGLTAGDLVYISKRDKSTNTQIEGTHSVAAITDDYHVSIPELSTGYVFTPSGTDGGVLFVYRPYTSYFNYVKFYEVDMIPFFMYATQSRINSRIEAPWQSIAPSIDYSDSNFSLIDNIIISENTFAPNTTANSVNTTGGNTSTSVPGGSNPLSVVR